MDDFNLLDLQGGEPLYIKSCREYFDYASNFNVEISILSNGTIMSEKIASQLMKSSRSIKISLNGGNRDIHELVKKGSNWNLVMKNIHYLKKT